MESLRPVYALCLRSLDVFDSFESWYLPRLGFLGPSVLSQAQVTTVINRSWILRNPFFKDLANPSLCPEKRTHLEESLLNRGLFVLLMRPCLATSSAPLPVPKTSIFLCSIVYIIIYIFHYLQQGKSLNQYPSFFFAVKGKKKPGSPSIYLRFSNAMGPDMAKH